ncbi:MAG: glycine cleavage T C-terminal barrel domain-containing protein [Thermoanaerobaculia bacterium]|nr:glycine cleavage T C-terminal barrel domain-containing protein [Thermoanaerobaculia bacterium]
MSDEITAEGVLSPVREEPGADLRRLDGGPEVPESFGDPEDEYEAIREDRALIDRSWAPEALFTGEDRTRFLDGLVTCHLPERAGQGFGYGFFTDVKGKILADAWIAVRPSGIVVELPPGRAETIREHATKYRIADRVEISLRYPVRLFLPGEDGSSLDLEPLSIGTGREVEPAGFPVWAEAREVWGVPGLVLTAERIRGEALWEHLRAGRRPVGLAALETARIEAGFPRFGRDFDSTSLPQETGLEDRAVSYEKGCYLGQEVVARIHYRGAVKRRLRGIEVEGEEVPPTGAEIRRVDTREDGRPVGRLTSVTRSPAFQRVLGLSILHDRGNQPGTEVRIGEAHRGRVVELPFA